jgi:hypothetical protein
MKEVPPAADACCHNDFYVRGRGVHWLLLFLPFLPLLASPPLPAFMNASSTLSPSFPLVAFDVFLGSVVFVLLLLPVVDIVEAFRVGI